MQKLYCYIDENGQDTNGRIFVVAAVTIAEAEYRDEMVIACEQYETDSGKGKAKWGKSKLAFRLEYLRKVFEDSRFHGNLSYSIFRNTVNYDEATITAIARTLNRRGRPTRQPTCLLMA